MVRTLHKCITISLTTSDWSHCFCGLWSKFGKVQKFLQIFLVCTVYLRIFSVNVFFRNKIDRQDQGIVYCTWYLIITWMSFIPEWTHFSSVKIPSSSIYMVLGWHVAHSRISSYSGLKFHSGTKLHASTSRN